VKFVTVVGSKKTAFYYNNDILTVESTAC